jgi:hypothetical protein
MQNAFLIIKVTFVLEILSICCSRFYSHLFYISYLDHGEPVVERSPLSANLALLLSLSGCLLLEHTVHTSSGMSSNDPFVGDASSAIQANKPQAHVPTTLRNNIARVGDRSDNLFFEKITKDDATGL